MTLRRFYSRRLIAGVEITRILECASGGMSIDDMASWFRLAPLTVLHALSWAVDWGVSVVPDVIAYAPDHTIASSVYR